MSNIKKLSNNKYQITVDYIGRDGKRKYKKKSVIINAASKKEIQKELNRLREEFKQEVREAVQVNSLIKFKDFIEVYKKEYMQENMKEYTIDEYMHVLSRRALPMLGNKSLGKIKPDDIKIVYNNMKEAGNKISTIKKVHTILKGIFVYAYRMQYINDIPTSKLLFPKTEESTFKERVHFFDIEQSKIFLSLFDMEFEYVYKEYHSYNMYGPIYVDGYIGKRKPHLQFKVFFYLALFGGFRRGELIALTWDDIDFENKTITINKSMKELRNNKTIIKEPKTKSSYRTITMPDCCMDLLKQWKELNQYENIFIQDNGKPMCLTTPYQKMKRLITKYNETAEVKLPLIRLHDLRHTAATILIANNVDIETVAHRLGHGRTSTTLNIYGHPMEEPDKKASEILSKLI